MGHSADRRTPSRRRSTPACATGPRCVSSGPASRTPPWPRWPLRAPEPPLAWVVTPLPALCLNVLSDQLPATAIGIARHRFPLRLDTEATATLLVSAHTQIGDEFSLSHQFVVTVRQRMAHCSVMRSPMGDRRHIRELSLVAECRNGGGGRSPECQRRNSVNMQPSTWIGQRQPSLPRSGRRSSRWQRLGWRLLRYGTSRAQQKTARALQPGEP